MPAVDKTELLPPQPNKVALVKATNTAAVTRRRALPKGDRVDNCERI
jgi:hypothetical protein